MTIWNVSVYQIDALLFTIHVCSHDMGFFALLKPSGLLFESSQSGWLDISTRCDQSRRKSCAVSRVTIAKTQQPVPSLSSSCGKERDPGNEVGFTVKKSGLCLSPTISLNGTVLWLAAIDRKANCPRQGNCFARRKLLPYSLVKIMAKQSKLGIKPACPIFSRRKLSKVARLVPKQSFHLSFVYCRQGFRLRPNAGRNVWLFDM